MRHLWNLLLLVAITISNSRAALAQATCADWAKVTAWQGTYKLSGNGTASSGPTSFTIHQNSSATVKANVFEGSCPGQLAWLSQDSNVSATVNDTAVSPCPPPGGGSSTTNVTSDSPAGSATGLTIDTSNGIFTFASSPGANVTLKSTNCQGQMKSVPASWPLMPAPNWPLTFPLPSSVQPLKVSNFPFADGAGLDGGIPLNNPWLLSFTLKPILNDDVDDPCPKDGGSSIACQNQSLQEDVPIVGTDFFLHYESGRSPGRAGAFGAATTNAVTINGWSLNVNHAFDVARNILFLGDGSQRSAWQLSSPVAFNSNYLLTSQDGSDVYVFEGTTGRHVQTLRPLTGAVEYQFGYDAAGNLITITDGSGNVTTIVRDASEHPKSIVSTYGEATSLTLDSNGFLNQVTDPAGNTESFINSSSGLLMSRTDANGNVYTYTYGGQGALNLDSDPVGGFTGLTLTDTATSDGVALKTALGRTSSYQSNYMQSPGEQLTNTWPNGLQASTTKVEQNEQLSERTTLPDGTTDSQTWGPDPRFGLTSPVLIRESLKQGGLTMNITGSRVANFTQGNPFSLTAQTDTETVNGREYTSVFTTSTKSWVDTTPAKRQTTTILDSLERISSVQLGAQLAVQFAYDAKGRLSTMTQGTRVTTLTYDSRGFPASSTNPLNQTTTFTHNAAGRLITETLPDGRTIAYSYDPNGNLTSLTPPGKTAHDFSYTAVDEVSAYTPPGAAGTGATSYTYDADRELTKVSRPDGETIAYSYDNAGRLSSIATPTENITYSYDATTGNVSGASINGGEALAYTYNGPLPTSSILTGIVAGTVSRTFDNNFWPISESINGGNTVSFTYDSDGLLTSAGSLTMILDPKDGLITGTTLGSATDSRKYDAFGGLTEYTAKHGANVLFSDTLTRDGDGRISSKTETIGANKNIYVYTYDLSGRLTGVAKNGVSLSSYTYDSNSNRLTATTSSGTVVGTYDAQDRLLTYGNVSCTYTANGELASQTVDAQTTIYSYDVLGNLIAVNLPNGTKIGYLVDAENHRVGKVVNGTLLSGFLYDDDRVLAKLDASNALVSQFVYGSRSSTPTFMIRGGVTYRIFSDELGSPRLVVNASNGVIAEQIDYDEFGNVVSDTERGFQPFGFAGGIYDQDTKLVRFGDRDYNAAVGRWTAKDPILFAGGSTNLFAYALNDPVNNSDADGDQTRALKLYDPNSQAAQASNAATQINDGTDLAMKAGSAVVDGELKTFVGNKALNAAKDQIAPGPEKEQEKILEEDRKSIPVTKDLAKQVMDNFKKSLGPCPTPPPGDQTRHNGAPPNATQRSSVSKAPQVWTTPDDRF
jgi:RHS repeat-associated protein